MSTPTKVLFLEVDAGDERLLRRWAADGTLPTFRSLLERGLSGSTLAPDGFFIGGLWPSLYTGVTPARHGIYSYIQLKSGTYDFYRCYTGEEILREPFWNLMSRAGRRVAIFDVPLAGLSKEINGIHSVEWGAHDPNYDFCGWPADFEADVRKRFGLHPLTQSCNAYGRTPEDFVALRDTLINGVRKKSELTRHYLAQGGWDFFAQVFTESHCIGHQCWHLHDPQNPAYDREIAALTGDPVREVYVAIDRAIREILAEVSDDTIVVVLAAHGMSHRTGVQFLLPEILERLGVAVRREVDSGVLGRVDDALTRIWQHTPGFGKRALSGYRDTLRAWFDNRIDGPPLPPHIRQLDPSKSRCFLTDNGFPTSGLRLNLVGREPSGLIEPGPDEDAFCAKLSADLLDLVDTDTGIPLVKEVFRTKDRYEGEYLDRLPDLVVIWNEEHVLGSASCGNPTGSTARVHSNKIGTVEGVNTYVRTGDHRPQGMFVALGPGIRAGQLDRTVSIMDFAPTFCALLDVELEDIDGHTIAEIMPT